MLNISRRDATAVPADLRGATCARSRPAAGRRGITFVEILIALFIIAGLGVTIQGMMVSTLKGVQVDRVAEVKRNLTLDLLEMFCHPYSALPSLFPAGAPSPATRELSTDEAIELVGIPQKEADLARAILTSGGVTGFSLVWHRGITSGTGDPTQALRLDRLWCRPVQSRPLPGPQVNSFRVFYMRGS